MAQKGEERREAILAIAEQLVLRKGFSGTSIDEILSRANITKGGFFYHFSGKNDLAKALMQRYLVQDDAFFRQLFERADVLSEEPLQQMLIFLKLLAEAMENLPDVHPGCLVASFAYETEQFDEGVRQLAVEGVTSWQQMFLQRLQVIAQQHSMRLKTNPVELADMLTAIIEGGILLSRVLDKQQILTQQILQYRNYLRLQFQ